MSEVEQAQTAGRSRVARRYARALFRLAGGDAAKTAEYQKSLQGILDLFKVGDAGRVLRSPAMPADLKKSLLDYALKQVAASPDVFNLVNVVVDAGRVSSLPELAAAFQELVDENNGVVRGDVITAIALPESEHRKIAEASARIFNRKVLLRPVVAPDILGGFVVKVGQYHIDMSLKTKLDGLAQRAAADSLR